MTLYSDLLQISLDGWAVSRAARAAARSTAPGASRAARSAASRAAQSAAAAASRAARSAAANAADAARGASTIRWLEYPEEEEEEEERRRIRTGTVPPPAPRVRWCQPGVDVTAQDMESDEATWALYEQWCKAYGKVRDRAEMEHRFHVFKSGAATVLSHNEACEGQGRQEDSICLGCFADGYSAQDVAKVKSIAAASGSPYLVSLIDSIEVDVFPPDQDQSFPGCS